MLCTLRLCLLPCVLLDLDPPPACCCTRSGIVPRRFVAVGQVYDAFTDAKKARDAAALRDFIERHRPNALVLGAGHPQALALRQDIDAVFARLFHDNPRLFTGARVCGKCVLVGGRSCGWVGGGLVAHAVGGRALAVA